MRRLAAAELREQQQAGARVLDVREPPMFADAHVRGSLNLPLSNRAAPHWLSTLVDPGERLVVVTATEREGALVEQLLAISERTASGFLPFDRPSLEAAGVPVASIRTITPPQLAAERDRLTVVDVREPQEWLAGHVPGAVWIPLAELPRRAHEVPAGPVATICASGFRSSSAASILEAAGRDDLANVWGGTSAWMQLGYPVRRGRES